MYIEIINTSPQSGLLSPDETCTVVCEIYLY